MPKYNDEFPDDDLDDVSVSSNNWDADADWNIEEILAEKAVSRIIDSDNGSPRREWVKLFLIKWEGWDLRYASWEPTHNLIDGKEDTIHEWQQKCMQERREQRMPFDLEQWEADQENFHKRKDCKRARQGLSPLYGDSDDESDDDEAFTPGSETPPRPSPVREESSDSDRPLSMVRQKPLVPLVRERPESSRDIPVRPAKIRRVSVTKTTARNVAKNDIGQSPAVPRTLSMPKNKVMANANLSGRRSTVVHKPTYASIGVHKKPSASKDILKNWDQTKSRKRTWLNSSENQKGQAFHTLQQQNWAQKGNTTDRRAPAAPTELSALTTTNKLPALASERRRNQQDQSTSAYEDGTLICWYWKNGSPCTWGAVGNCGLEHSNRGARVANERNQLTKSQATCPFWYEGHCRNQPQNCKFTHGVTPYLAKMTESKIERIDPAQPPKPDSDYEKELKSSGVLIRRAEVSVQPSPVNEVSSAPRGELQLIPHDVLVNYDGRPHPQELLGCSYYNFGSCNKPDWQCSFSHVKTRWVKQPNGPPRFNPQGDAFWDPARQRNILEGRHWSLDKGSRASSPEQQPWGNLSLEPRRIALPYHSRGADSQDPDDVVDVEVASDTIMTLVFHAPDSAPRPAGVRLSGLASHGVALLQHHAEPSGALSLEYTLTSEDGKQYSVFNGEESLDEGDILQSRQTKDGAASLDLIHSTLTAHHAAAVVFETSFSAIIYPSKSDWARSLARKRDHPDGLMKIQLFPPREPPAQLRDTRERREASAANDNNDRELRFSHYAKLYEMFSIDFLLQTATNKVASRVAFIVHEPSHQDEVDGLAQHLANVGVKVYSSTNRGSWAYFKAHHETSAGGLIMIHDKELLPTMNSLTDVDKFLSNGRFNFFLISMADSIPQQLPTPEIKLIFGGGQAVYLMDDCMTRQPHKTLEVLKQLQLRSKHGSTLTHVIGRPGLLDWAERLAEEEKQAAEKDMYESDETKRNIFALLSELNQGDGLAKVHCLDQNLVSDYEEQWASNMISTANSMVDWFASWTIDEEHLDKCRKFFVLTNLKKPMREAWKAKHAHLTILEPLQWVDLERAGQDKKERRSRA